MLSFVQQCVAKEVVDKNKGLGPFLAERALPGGALDLRRARSPNRVCGSTASPLALTDVRMCCCKEAGLSPG